VSEPSDDGTNAASRGATLLERVLNGESDDGRLLNDLVTAFYAGYPIAELRRLLSARDEKIVSSGAWIASELGSRGRPLMVDVLALLGYPTAKVRYYAVDFFMNTVEAGDAGVAASVAVLIDDPDPGVRRAVMGFLTVIPEAALRAAEQETLARNRHQNILRGLRVVIDSVRDRDTRAISGALVSKDATLRRCAAAAAARLRPHDPGPFQDAIRSDDADISTFATRLATRRLRNVH
jgi:hypothetical protein